MFVHAADPVGERLKIGEHKNPTEAVMYQLTAEQRASLDHLEALGGTGAQLTPYGNGYDPDSEFRYWLAELTTTRSSITFVIYPHARMDRIDADDIHMTGVEAADAAAEASRQAAARDTVRDSRVSGG
jgi:hypothetical protein